MKTCKLKGYNNLIGNSGWTVFHLLNFYLKIRFYQTTRKVFCWAPETQTLSFPPEHQSPPTFEVYCYWQGPEDGDMVGYDNSKCTHKWFHLSCLNLKVFPKCKRWFCPDCKNVEITRPCHSVTYCNSIVKN